MSNYGDQFMKCPMCGGKAESDAVDVGVGLYIAGNFACHSCDWEIDGPISPELAMTERQFAPAESIE